MNNKRLLERCENFMSELGVSKTAFCKHVQISVSAFYAWRSGQLALSDMTLSRIDKYLVRPNY